MSKNGKLKMLKVAMPVLVVVATIVSIVSCTNTYSVDKLIVPGIRVSNYVIGKHSISNILGEDTSENRKYFSDQGLMFSFNESRILSSITITSNQYLTTENVRIGSSRDAVLKVYGVPIAYKLTGTHGKSVRVPALSYNGISFVMENDMVSAIIVHYSSQLSPEKTPLKKK